MRVLCIDPGVTCGLALFEGKNLARLWSGSIATMIEAIASERPSAVVYEDSRLQAHVWSLKGASTVPAKLKAARNVGSVDGVCAAIESICIAGQTRSIPVSPAGKGRKLNAHEFTQITGFAGTTNQHQRDAAMLFPAARYQLMEAGKRG